MTRAIESLESIVRAEKDYISVLEMLDKANMAGEGALGVSTFSVCVIVKTCALSCSENWGFIDGSIPSNIKQLCHAACMDECAEEGQDKSRLRPQGRS